ncbi:hypothetical protein QL093DRAFT_2401733 [Fusarium oxysporum]|nr:hypothetical protein QL093DRAFT_2401733 [Fusarium oxysporum]
MIIAFLHPQQNNMRSNQVHPRLLESFEKSYFGCQLCTVKALLEYPNVTWRQGVPMLIDDIISWNVCSRSRSYFR